MTAPPPTRRAHICENYNFKSCPKNHSGEPISPMAVTGADSINRSAQRMIAFGPFALYFLSTEQPSTL
jgi:hypothetical protein